jgi:hypothetical protein
VNSYNDNKSEAFFLPPDEAQTLGDSQFMRKSVKVRRTFPKTASNAKGGEQIKEISSLEQKNNNSNGKVESASNFNSTIEPSVQKEVQERRANDSNMDMFLNMARNLKK